MATDVSSLVRILNSYNEEQRRKQEQIKNTDHQGKSMSLITRDLLGGSCSSSSSISEKELDLDLQVPNGWEKRLDMKSGNIYIQKCNPSPSNHQQTSILHQEIHDLNSKSSTTTTKSKDLVREEETLDLKLQLVVPSYDYQSSSVCTLDKVKSALERVQTESSSSSLLKKRTLTVSTTTTTDTKISNGGIASSSSCSSSSPSSNLIDQEEENDKKKKSSSSSEGVMFAAGCPGCLSYVLISNKNPNCPRCDCKIPSPNPSKKPRIDLNLSV